MSTVNITEKLINVDHFMFLNGKLYIVKMLLPSRELQRFETFLMESLFTSGTPLVSKGQCAVTQRLKLAVNKFGNPRKDPFAASGDSAQNPALFTYTLNCLWRRPCGKEWQAVSRSWVTPGQEAPRKQRGIETCQQVKLGGKLGKEFQALGDFNSPYWHFDLSSVRP